MQLVNLYTSPLGRCNRLGLLRVTLVMLAAQAAALALVWATGGASGPFEPITKPFEVITKVFFFWIGYCAMAKRLHDLGRSAWWIPGFALGLIVWSLVQTVALLLILGPVAYQNPELILGASVLATVTPVLAATIWLHYALGEPSANRYGPAPGDTGMSQPGVTPCNEGAAHA